MNWWLLLGYGLLGFGCAMTVDGVLRGLVVYGCFAVSLNILIDQLA